MSVFDAPVAPKKATSENNVTKVQDLLLSNCCSKVPLNVKTKGISTDSIGHSLQKILAKRKLSMR